MIEHGEYSPMVKPGEYNALDCILGEAQWM